MTTAPNKKELDDVPFREWSRSAMQTKIIGNTKQKQEWKTTVQCFRVALNHDDNKAAERVQDNDDDDSSNNEVLIYIIHLVSGALTLWYMVLATEGPDEKGELASSVMQLIHKYAKVDPKQRQTKQSIGKDWSFRDDYDHDKIDFWKVYYTVVGTLTVIPALVVGSVKAAQTLGKASYLAYRAMFKSTGAGCV